jgi:uncharacterized protein (UPF0332 family)
MEAAQQLLDHALGFVQPVLWARVGNGTWRPDDTLSSFRVVMTDGAPLIQVNDEDRYWTVPVAARSFAEGEEIAPAELITYQAEAPDHELPYIAGTRTDGGWELSFDLDRPHPRRLEFLELAGEYVSAAESVLNIGLVRPFIGNAFHAAEHLARAELLCYPITTGETLAAHKHTHVASIYNLWARLGNTDAAFSDLLNKLSSVRPAANYLDKPLAWGEPEAREALLELVRFQRHVEKIAREGERPEIINVISTRDIEAGTLVRDEDAAFRPTKKKGSRAQRVS